MDLKWQSYTFRNITKALIESLNLDIAVDLLIALDTQNESYQTVLSFVAGVPLLCLLPGHVVLSFKGTSQVFKVQLCTLNYFKIHIFR